MWRHYGVSMMVAALASPAQAANKYSISIPALPLDQALILLGEQASVTIGGSDPRLRATMARPVRGRMSLQDALRRLLSGTGFSYVMAGPTIVRIIPAPIEQQRPLAKPLTPKPPPAPRPQAPLPEPEPEPPKDIIVTASKQNQSLADYSGSARIEIIGSPGLTAERGTAALVGRLPELSSTNLGPGRNKLFIRGVADSSFTGPTQSTVGLYLGDLRLTYNAPEPDLRLYDIDRIEVIEGPQGTLYGAGTLGGIIHIVPNKPNLSTVSGNASAGYTTTKSGAGGYDVSGAVNVPIIANRVAIRAVGYRQIAGGYIDNPLLGTRNTNRTGIFGGRVAIEIDPGNDWRISAMGVIQYLNTRDGQYAESGSPGLSHVAGIAEPHDNDFLGANLTIRKAWPGLELTSSFGIVEHRLDERFDPSSRIGVGTAYDRSDRIRTMLNETRLSSRPGARVTWVAGFNFISSTDRMEQFLGALPTPPRISSARSEREELALFGEATVPVSDRLSLTGGVRLIEARAADEVVGAGIEPNRRQRRALPTAAIAWKLAAQTKIFARLQSGFRGGGLAVDPAGTVNRFDSDAIYTVETGVRFGDNRPDGGTRLSGTATVFHTSWQDIQADLLDSSGLPTTLNIGNGHIDGIEAELAWRPNRSWLIEGATFINRSGIDSPATSLTGLKDQPLPNVPRYGARISARWTKQLSGDISLLTDGIVRYRSSSNIGTLPPLLLEQGEYTEADLAFALIRKPWKLSLGVSNLFDAKENSFAFGNPFTVATGDQFTPLRPRSVRLGLEVDF